LSEGLAWRERAGNLKELWNLTPYMICGIMGPEIVDLGDQILLGIRAVTGAIQLTGVEPSNLENSLKKITIRFILGLSSLINGWVEGLSGISQI